MEYQPRPGEEQQPLAPVELVVPRAMAPRPRRFGLGALLLVFLVFALGGSVLVNIALLAGDVSDSDSKVREKYHSHARSARQKVAIISMEGVILEDDGFVKRQIDRAAKDEDVRAVVLRVDSPGGSVSASHYLYHHLRRLAEESKKPVVVSMGGLAASGGYYVSMAVGSTPDTIFAEPTTWTGSIGVILPHFNVAGLFKEWGIEEDSIVSHPLKDMGTFARTMSDKERQILQALVDDGFRRFKEVVQAGRPRFAKDPAALDTLATGQLFTALQAQKAGLVDKIGFLEDAVNRAITLAKLDPDDVCVVKYQPESSLTEFLLGGQTRNPRLSLEGRLDPTACADLFTPRAYYLCTLVPSLIRTATGGR